MTRQTRLANAAYTWAEHKQQQKRRAAFLAHALQRAHGNNGTWRFEPDWWQWANDGASAER